MDRPGNNVPVKHKRRVIHDVIIALLLIMYWIGGFGLWDVFIQTVDKQYRVYIYTCLLLIAFIGLYKMKELDLLD